MERLGIQDQDKDNIVLTTCVETKKLSSVGATSPKTSTMKGLTTAIFIPFISVSVSSINHHK